VNLAGFPASNAQQTIRGQSASGTQTSPLDRRKHCLQNQRPHRECADYRQPVPRINNRKVVCRDKSVPDGIDERPAHFVPLTGRPRFASALWTLSWVTTAIRNHCRRKLHSSTTNRLSLASPSSHPHPHLVQMLHQIRRIVIRAVRPSPLELLAPVTTRRQPHAQRPRPLRRQ
jgi:hypothetical protein